MLSLPRRLSLLVAIWLTAGAAWARETVNEPLDLRIKAERIVAVAHFVEWPERRLPRPTAPLVIGVWGSDAITGPLMELLHNRQIKGHPVVVREVTDRDDLLGCHLVFFPRAENSRLESLLRPLRREGILTLGETEAFLGRGGVMSLLKVSDTYRLQVSADAVKRERLVVSSKLLQLALPPNFEVGSPVPARGSGVPER